MPIEYERKLIPYAKKLRREATPEENRLWYEFLRKYPVRFQRQKTIDHFIADFYCCKAKLIVELDGAQHYTAQGKAYDFDRTVMLSKYGLKVIRFSNKEINKSFWNVCNQIDLIVRERITFDGGAEK